MKKSDDNVIIQIYLKQGTNIWKEIYIESTVQVSTIQGSRKTASKGTIAMIVDNISIAFQKMY